MRKILPKSKIVPFYEADSVKQREVLANGTPTYFDVILRAQQCWDNLEDFRKRRDRCKRYTYGDQWGDKIWYNNRWITEEEYITSQGNVPLKNNLIRRLVRTVIGAYRNQNKEPVCTARDRDEQSMGDAMSVLLQYNYQLNRMKEVNGRTFEEFLISGAAFQKETYGWRNDRMDCWTDVVSPNRIFFNGSMQDLRHWDCNIIGELHDLSFDELSANFANSPTRYNELRDEYRYAMDRDYINQYSQQFSRHKLSNVDFLVPEDINMCRVIEVWTLERKPRLRCHDYLTGSYYKDEVKNERAIKEENQSRMADGKEQGIEEEDIPLIEYEWFVDNYWYYRYLTPFGHCLREGETPYDHHSHPYTIKMYPFIDGEVHSFVEDVIDQQRYINRMVILTDWIVRASAKGVLMFPEDLVPDNMTVEDIAEQWTKFNGMIIYKPKPGVPLPQQIANNSTNIGITDLLQRQMTMMEDISGVHGAVQGKQGFSGMSASLYAQQTQNATASLLDVLESYDGFIVEGAIKKVKNIQQYYDDKMILSIAGRNANVYATVNPGDLRDVECDLSVSEGTNTPVYRLIGNDFLMALFEKGQINIEQLLENGTYPFADKLLQSVRSQKEAMQKQQEQAQQMQQGQMA